MSQNVISRLRTAIALESAAISPQTSHLIEASKEAIEALTRTNRIAVKSLTFCDVDGQPHISLCTFDGQHYHLELTDSQCALLNEQAARFVRGLVERG